MPPPPDLFTNSRRGENAELKEEMSSMSNSRRKEALKRTIAAMTVGKDVSGLFPEVVQCVQTPHIDIKKLVYLYLINYAQSFPDLSILAVNTFVKDATDYNPLLRALAIRTMACIQIDSIVQYLCDPLRAAVKDPEPYVRKTAAMAIAKLHSINPAMVRDEGFLDALTGPLLTDENAMVVANALAALMDIASADSPETPADSLLKRESLPGLLSALNECNEWGQVFVLDALATPTFQAHSPQEADAIIERISPRLQHANPAVVMSSIRVIANNLGQIASGSIPPDMLKNLYKRVSAPLVTFMSAEPETQYVALRCTNLLIRVHPKLISHEVRVFFCKYNDPLYVKLEKLLLVVRLTNTNNLSQVLAELKEYAADPDICFVRRSISAIGSIAMKSEPISDRCVDALMSLMKLKVLHVVEQSLVVFQDILRRYPRYENTVAQICRIDFEEIVEPEAKAAYVWIIGQYCSKLPNAVDLMTGLLGTGGEEPLGVQLQLLTAAVKVFLVRGSQAEALLQSVLQLATVESENPALRDRGHMYARLLQCDSAVAKKVVLSAKPMVSADTLEMELPLLHHLVQELGMISSIFHAPAKTFVESAAREQTVALAPDAKHDEAPPKKSGGDLLDLDDLLGDLPKPLPGTAEAKKTAGSLLDDLFSGPAPPRVTSSGVDTAANVPALPGPDNNPLAFSPPEGLPGLTQEKRPTSIGLVDAVSRNAGSATVLPISVNQDKMKVLLPEDRGHGLVIRGQLRRMDSVISLDLSFQNNSSSPLSDFAIQFNANAFGLVPAEPLQLRSPLGPREVAESSVRLNRGGNVDVQKGCSLQIAVRCKPLSILYFAETISNYLDVVLEDNGHIEKKTFLQKWAAIPDAAERTSQFHLGGLSDAGECIRKLQAERIFLVAKKTTSSAVLLYLSAVLCGSRAVFLCELTVSEGSSQAKLALRVGERLGPGVVEAMQATIERLLA